MPLTPGDQFGPYEILAPIGKGGMGEVYRARDTRLRREVAIKVLPEPIESGPLWERFEREARAASALSHPNICAVYDVGAAAGRPFLVMELIEGQTLAAYIGQKPVDTATAVALALQIAGALEAAHAKGILHRDIKPANIMVTPGGHLKVLDFGLARQVPVGEMDETGTLETLTGTRTLVGTPHYMAPEILLGKPADVRSDIWALGVVLYQMLTGKLPFEANTVFELSSAILREDPAPLPPAVPASLRSVVECCLEKEPGNRYRSASEVRAALTPAPAHATPRRRRWLWAAGAAVLSVAGVLVWQMRPGTPRRLTSTGAPASASQEANDAFELAMQFQRVQNDFPKAQQFLERAISLDPNFAEALRYHAFNPLIMLMIGVSNDAGVAYKAEEELKRASRADPNLISLPSAFTALYLIQGRKELARPEALDRVLEQHPSHNDSRLWRAILRLFSGQYAGAKEDLRGILERESLNGAGRTFLGETLRIEGDVPGAMREQQRVLLQAPGNVVAVRDLSLAEMDAGDLDNARALLEEKRPLFARNYLWKSVWALLLAREGKREEALQAMDEETLKFLAAAFLTTLNAAEFYSVLGEKAKALEWLDKSIRNGDERTDWFRKDPSLEKIRQDPAFQRMIDSVESRRGSHRQ